MNRKYKIFISSVQNEFASHRQELKTYILSDPLLGLFFDVFLFEDLPAVDLDVQDVYLKEVERCDIYLGLFGKEYGFEDSEGISPTEREFDHASAHHKLRLIFLTDISEKERHQKEQKLINKAQAVLVRKTFENIEQLKSSVYASLIYVLFEKGKIVSGPFDASFHPRAIVDDISTEKLKKFIRLAKSKRGFPLPENAVVEDVLMHLNLIDDSGNITNAALLLFAHSPQKFFINSEVRCVHFHGLEMVKPIPSYKVYKGDVFALTDQAVDFIMSKLDYSVGTRAKTTDIPGKYEIPREIIAEVIVNAVVHRDYTGNGSVQIMLFKDRLEVHNPGTLPLGWTVKKLKQIHTSVPFNPLLAYPMYLAGYIERLGTGITDMLKLAEAAKLREPFFEQNEDFKAVIYRPSFPATGKVTGGVTGEATGEVAGEVKKVIMVLNGEMKRSRLQAILEIKHDEYFLREYIKAAVNQSYIAMTYPNTPNHPNQKYYLTTKGKKVQKQLISKPEYQATDPVTDQATDPVTDQVKKLMKVINGEMSRQKLMRLLNLKHKQSFRENYLRPALNLGILEMTIPEKPNDSKQKYRLTSRGKSLKKQLEDKE